MFFIQMNPLAPPQVIAKVARQDLLIVYAARASETRFYYCVCCFVFASNEVQEGKTVAASGRGERISVRLDGVAVRSNWLARKPKKPEGNRGETSATKKPDQTT